MVIRMRHTRSHTANRRSHHALEAINVTKDSKTGATHLRHRADLKTGLYRGKKILDVVKKVEKKQAKNKAK
jgi:large subunit ribosomal protein L32